MYYRPTTALKIFYTFLIYYGNQHVSAIYEGWNFNSGNYLFTTDTK